MAREASNPYASGDVARDKDQVGASRLLFWFFFLITLAIAYQPPLYLLFPEPSAAVNGAVLVAYGLFSVVVTVMRLKNVGARPWHALGILVPIYQLVVLWICLVYPSGFYPERKLDDAGKLLTLPAGGLLALLGIVQFALAALFLSPPL